MSKNILTTKTINSPRNKKSNANGDGRIVPRLQRNENSKSAPGLQDSLNSNEGLESFNTSNNNNTNVVITNSKKKKKKKEKTISPPVVSGEVIHEFGLWKNVKKNVDKADKALDSYKKNMDNDGTTTSKKSSKKDKNRSKNSSSIVEKNYQLHQKNHPVVANVFVDAMAANHLLLHRLKKPKLKKAPAATATIIIILQIQIFQLDNYQSM